jgi:hypothetical protein
LEILADENVRRDLINTLRAAGHDVVWIADVDKSAPDEDVFDRAVSENRLLLTSDLDFSDMVYRQQRAGLRGLIQIRIDIPDAGAFLSSIMESWALVQSFEGVTTVLEPGKIRQRPLP